MAKNNDTALAVKPVENTAMAAYDYGADAGNLGFEGTDGSDFSIPFLGVLQSNSPICQENENARPGMIRNTVTGDLIKGSEGLPFIPCATQHNYIEWEDDGAGTRGKFVAVHEIDSDIVRNGRQTTKFGKIPMPGGKTMLSETYTIFGIALLPDGPQQVAVSFSSTKIKPYKNFMTKARTLRADRGDGVMAPAPLMAHRYRLKTFLDENPKGKFFNYEISFDGADAKSCRLTKEDELFKEAVAFNKAITTGAVKANHAKNEGGDTPVGEDEIPF